MLWFYILTSIFIAWIWVDYFRLIDLYDKEDLRHFILVFILGAGSVNIVWAIQEIILKPLNFDLNGEFINDFLFSTFGIGLVEEVAKIIPFLIFYSLFKKAVNEPIDILAYLCVSALGFSAAENTLYFMQQGPEIISGRAVLATITHMFSTALFGYGIIRYKYFFGEGKKYILFLYLFFAALSHGFYDFWLLHKSFAGSWMITILYFLITISLFSNILNNAINHSKYFTYRKVIHTNKVIKMMLFYYFIVFLIQFSFLGAKNGFLSAFVDAISSIYLTGFIVVVSVTRLSRFKLIKQKWHPLKFELPFGILNSLNNTGGSSYRFKIKGDPYDETYLNNHYQDFFMLHPISNSSSFLENDRLAYITDKVFLKNDETYFLVKIYMDDEFGPWVTKLLKPKTYGNMFLKDRYPIVAIYDVNNNDLTQTDLTNKDFNFEEWAYAKPRQYFR
jgi:RsiW-degrading membrane proteinase PrsW (M82 family)